MEGFVQGKNSDGGPIHQERVKIILTAKSQQYHDVAEKEQYFVTVFFIVYPSLHQQRLERVSLERVLFWEKQVIQRNRD